MKYIRINRINEANFDTVIELAGGKRIEANVTNQKGYYADYRLKEAIVELKLIREEGIIKESRRNKVAELFRKSQPGRPVIVLDTNLLSQSDLQKYLNLMGQPIQTAIKKSAKQLQDSNLRLGIDNTRVLVILNDGYTALNINEFREVVGKIIRNDTTKIDYAIVGGIYYYSDKFDSFFISRFDLIPVNIVKPFPSYGVLLTAWNQWVNSYMTSVVLGQESLDDDRTPIIDLNFEIDGIEYVKICPPMGKPSKFWPGGKRPREDSTGIESCPPVAICFPKLSKQNWVLFKKNMQNESRLQNDYRSWLIWAKEKKLHSGTDLQPFVEVDIMFEECVAWFNKPVELLSFATLCEYAAEVFQTKIISIIDSSINKDTSKIIIPSYIFLLTEEIGQDKAFDISSIYYINETPGFERDEIILENKKLFFEYALSLASAYAFSKGLETVIYQRDEKYSWT
jgi:hypothetical protein